MLHRNNIFFLPFKLLTDGFHVHFISIITRLKQNKPPSAHNKNMWGNLSSRQEWRLHPPHKSVIQPDRYNEKHVKCAKGNKNKCERDFAQPLSLNMTVNYFKGFFWCIALDHDRKNVHLSLFLLPFIRLSSEIHVHVISINTKLKQN